VKSVIPVRCATQNYEHDMKCTYSQTYRADIITSEKTHYPFPKTRSTQTVENALYTLTMFVINILKLIICIRLNTAKLIKVICHNSTKTHENHNFSTSIYILYACTHRRCINNLYVSSAPIGCPKCALSVPDSASNINMDYMQNT